MINFSNPFKNLLFFLSLFYTSISFINCACSMAQSSQDGNIHPAEGNETIPSTIQPEDTYCQDFVGKETCCTTYQVNQLLKNFQAIESIFGGDGGCDVCVVNLKRFWCHFACNPNQDKFVQVGNLTNYTIDGKVYQLRDINYSITDEANCALFHSCKKTKFVAQVPSMGNAIGFTNFQGINAYTKMPVYITMKIDNENGVTWDNDPCDLDVPSNGDIRGYKGNKNCTCNSCEHRCKYDSSVSIPITNGLNLWLIIGFYIFVAVATAGLFFYKKYGSKDNNEYERPSNVYDEKQEELVDK